MQRLTSGPVACAATARAAHAGAPQQADTLALWWVRPGDMRLADNEALTAAAAPHVRFLLPLLCLDPSELGPRRGAEGAGVPMIGPHRCR
jgi:hypothetical protein